MIYCKLYSFEVVKRTDEDQTSSLVATLLKMEEKMGKFKQMCNDLFIYLSDLIFSVPTPSTSSLVAPLSDTTPIKK